MADFDRDQVLAAVVQLVGCLPPDILKTALTSWISHPARPLAEYLRETGVVEERLLQNLQSLVAEHLEKRGEGARESLAGWNGEALTHRTLTEPDAQPVPESTIASPMGTTMPVSPGTTLAAEEPAEAASPEDGAQLPSYTQEERFQRVRRHARGGIGEVWLALDRELQREVAVKEIQERYVDRKDQRKRFLLEAEITGSLEHPGIVPVYSLGRNHQGQPFYAMRFIRGESLSAAIRRFHDARRKAASTGDQASAATWGIEFQQLLRRFLDVCDAMEYAHSRDVIHRDLKPANIMLGEYGETLVVDWGLAKVVGREDIAPAMEVSPGAGDVDRPPGTNAGGETQPGTTIGTPSYMSPEQARGDLADLGPASDVYSLGATLYELLTGIFPFAAENAQEILERVKKGTLMPPRSLVPSIPAPLEAICLKAMAFNPADRYQSARELASDLEHWMADEPVGASPDSPLQRATRWMRRHRSFTYAVAATLLGVALVATGALFLVDGARRSEEEARRLAEQNFKMAQQAVDVFLTNVSENTLLKEQDTTDLRTLRQDLLRSALPYYEKFVKQGGQDPALREQLANAYYRLGAITEVIESSDEALKLYRASVDVWEELIKSAPGDLEYKTRLADCRFAVGKLLNEQQSTEALNWLTAALRAYESLSREKPTDPVLQASIANCLSEMGLCHSYELRIEPARQALGRGRAVQERLVERAPRDIELLKGLAEIVNRQGYVEYRGHEYAAALETYEEFQRICLEILNQVQVGPKPLRIRALLARSHYNIGAMKLEQNRLPEALDAYRNAEASYSKLAYDHPSVMNYQQSLGECHLSIATVRFRLKNHGEAQKAIARATVIFDQLCKAEPENVNYQYDRSMVLELQGVVFDAQRDNGRAEKPFRESLELRRAIFQKNQGDDFFKAALCLSLANMGENETDRGHVEEGLRLYAEALRYRRELVSSNSALESRLRDLVELTLSVGEIQAQSSDCQAAFRLYGETGDAVERVLRDRPDSPALLELRARILIRQGAVGPDAGQREQSTQFLERGIDSCRDLLRSDQESGPRRAMLTEGLWELARIHPDRTVADRANAERGMLWKDRALEPLLELASQEAIRAQIIGYGKYPLTEPGEAVRRTGFDRAAATLKLLVALGYRDIKHLQGDLDLAPLLERNDVKALVGK